MSVITNNPHFLFSWPTARSAPEMSNPRRKELTIPHKLNTPPPSNAQTQTQVTSRRKYHPQCCYEHLPKKKTMPLPSSFYRQGTHGTPVYSQLDEQSHAQ